jgi:hypothetical protein
MTCPHCGGDCWHESVDVEVGVIHGPWGCSDCGWSEDPAYDCRSETRMDGEDRVFDQFGVSHHVSRLDGMAVLAGLHIANQKGTSS